METIMRKVCITLLHESIPGITRQSSQHRTSGPGPMADKGQAKQVANKLSRRLVAVASPRLRMGDLPMRVTRGENGLQQKWINMGGFTMIYRTNTKLGSQFKILFAAFWTLKLCQAAFVSEIRLLCHVLRPSSNLLQVLTCLSVNVLQSTWLKFAKKYWRNISTALTSESNHRLHKQFHASPILLCHPHRPGALPWLTP